MSENDGNLPAPAAHYVTKVAVKLLDFWSDDPDLWFIHAESAFRNAQVTQSRTKFDHVVQKLPQNIMVSVRGLILSSSSTSSTPYEDLKAKLVASYTLLPEDEVPGSLFLGLFLERLPVEMRDHLVAKDFKNPSEMALHADKLWDARRAQSVDSSLLTAASTSPSHAPGRDRSDGSPVCRSQTPGPSGAGECYFHKCFGNSANNCRPPRSFQGNSRADGRRRN